MLLKKMIATMMLAGSVVGLGACQQQAPETVHPKTVDIKTMRDETVTLVRSNGSEFDMYCAGIWIGEKKILTANHCVRGAMIADIEAAMDDGVEPPEKLPDPAGYSMYYRTYGDYLRDHEEPTASRARKVSVVRVEKATDLALLEISGVPPQHSIVALSAQPLTDGSEVWVVGHSVGMQFTLSRGIVSASRRDADLTLLQLSVAISPGNSGGPVFDTDGNLVGVVSFMLRGGALVSFATHRDSIKDFLQSN